MGPICAGASEPASIDARKSPSERPLCGVLRPCIRPRGRGSSTKTYENCSVAMLEAARFALMRHFLCSEELLPRQTFCDDVSALGRQLGVRVTGYCRGEIEPHMGAHPVLGDASPILVHDAEVELGFAAAIRYHFIASPWSWAMP
jgi:hypothetical protein